MFPIYWYFIFFTATFCFSKTEVLIVSTKSGLVFDGNEKNVKAVEPNNSEGQKWILERLQNGHFVIVSAKNETLALDVQKGCKTGQNIIVFEKHSRDNQQFSLNRDGTIGTNCTQNLILQIKNGNVETGPKASACSADSQFKFVKIK